MFSSLEDLLILKLALGLVEADKDRSIADRIVLDELSLVEPKFVEVGTGTTLITAELDTAPLPTLPEFFGDWLGSVRWGEGSPSTAIVEVAAVLSGDIGDEVKRG